MNIIRKKMNNNSKIIASNITPQEEEKISFSNPLLQTLTSQEFNEENFLKYQQDLRNIFTYLMKDILSLSVQINLDNIRDASWVESMLK